MAKTAYPQVGTATTDAQYSELFASVIGTGVRETTEFTVAADSTGLVVKVAPGFAVVSGNALKSTAVEALTIAANSGQAGRIDTVILRRDFAATNVVDLAVKQGSPSTTPAAPTLTQDVLGVWEEPLADVAVASNAASIVSANITDRRRFLSSRVGAWTSAARPGGRPGRVGLNLDTGTWEGFSGGVWGPLTTWANLPGKPDAFTPAWHTHDDRYYPRWDIDGALSGKSNNGHIHDDRYYPRWDIDGALNGKSNNGHTHDDRYFLKSEIGAKQGEARMACGLVQVFPNTDTGGDSTKRFYYYSGTAHVDYPAGRFTSTPAVTATAISSATRTQQNVTISNLTANGFDITYTRDETIWTTISWIAVQS